MLDANEIRANGLICWRNNERPCGADCMAFIEAPEGADFQGKQWANCSVLVNQHRTAKHLTIIAHQLTESSKLKRNEIADRARTNQPPPPKVV